MHGGLAYPGAFIAAPTPSRREDECGKYTEQDRIRTGGTGQTAPTRRSISLCDWSHCRLHHQQWVSNGRVWVLLDASLGPPSSRGTD
jgi:hypothetical protein